jgi:hypothetical protein
MTFKPFAAGLGALTLLLASGSARADSAIRTVADLTASTCIPALRAHELKPEMMWPELQPVSADNLKTLNFKDGGRYWATKSDEGEIVFMELVENRCKVFTSKLGSAAFLPELEERLSDAFSKPVQLSDKVHPTDSTLRIRVYDLHIDGEEGARIGVTYPTDATPEKGRMFYVTVVLTETKLVDKP